MVQRVNFLERGKYALTYQNMAIVVVLWILLCLAIHSIFVLQGVWTRTKVAGAKKVEQIMTAEFEQQVQLIQVSKRNERTGTAIQSLASVFQHLPHWSQALAQLAGAVPGQIWLTIVKSVASAAGDVMRHVEIEGRGRSAEAITEFVQRLDETPLFQNVVLARSTKDAEKQELYFTIGADLVFTD